MLPQPAGRSEMTANSPRARTRHGCWTCRKRRRKCDEQKPRCQNCIGKGLKCKYGLQLTFHEANLFKLMPDEARALSEQAPDRYQTVQFVDGMGDVQDELENASGEDEARTVETLLMPSPRREVHDEQAHNMLQAMNDVSSNNDHPLDSYRRLQDEAHYVSPQVSFGPQGLDHVLDEGAHTSDARSLQQPYGEPSRSLGDSNTGHTYSPLSSTILCDGRQQSYNSTLPPNRSLQNNNLQSAVESNHPITPSIAVVSERNPKTNHELMKFFIDKVAPWLDLCDPISSYATHLPITSSRFPPLRFAILSLSAAQASKFQSSTLVDINESAPRILGSDMYSRREEAISARNLLQIAHVLSHPIHSWRSLLAPHASYLDEMGIHGFRDGHLRAAAWITLRFDLAIAINSQSPILTQLALWQHPSLESEQSAYSVVQTTSHLENALLLCAKIANLAFTPNAESYSTSEIWNGLYAQFQSIQSSQQSDSLLPLLSSQIGSFAFSKPDSQPSTAYVPSEFPLHIHTSRVSFYSAFLTHFISILLLISRPRNVERTMSSRLKTTTWHAVHVCGLSMSNNILWSTDPVVVAALLHAGPSLSYVAQQIELLRHLRRLEKTTGWKFGGEVVQLEEFWRASS